jgi:hypothetical protein
LEEPQQQIRKQVLWRLWMIFSRNKLDSEGRPPLPRLFSLWALMFGSARF